jgi:hypothetical protein
LKLGNSLRPFRYQAAELRGAGSLFASEILEQSLSHERGPGEVQRQDYPKCDKELLPCRIKLRTYQSGQVEPDAPRRPAKAKNLKVPFRFSPEVGLDDFSIFHRD